MFPLDPETILVGIDKLYVTEENIDSGVPTEMVRYARERARLIALICVEPAQYVSGGQSKAFVYCMGLTPVGLDDTREFHNAWGAWAMLQYRFSLIDRTIIEHDVLYPLNTRLKADGG